MLLAERVPPPALDGNRVPAGLMNDVVLRPALIGQQHGFVVVREGDLEDMYVGAGVQTHVCPQLCTGLRVWLERVDRGVGHLRCHQRVGTDVGSDVEHHLSCAEQELEQRHVVVVIHPLAVDQCRDAVALVARDDPRLR